MDATTNTAKATEPTKDPKSASLPGVLSISGKRVVANIDALDDIAGYAVVHGREIAVHHLDALAYRAIEALRDNPETANVTDLYDAAARACPDLSREEIDKLSGPKIGALLAVAERAIKEVEASIPNGPGPTETDSTSPSPPA